MNLTVEYDNRIRVTASAFLLTKFVHENSGYKRHPLMVATLNHIKHLQEHPYIRLVNQMSNRLWMNAFYNIAVLMEWSGSVWMLPDGVYKQLPELRTGQYSELFTQFYYDSDLNTFWEATSEQWEQVAEESLKLIEQGNVAAYLEQIFGPVHHNLILVPNPLDPASFGFGVSSGFNCYSLIGPPAVPLVDGVEPHYREWGLKLAGFAVHEFSHPLLSEARRAYPIIMENTRFLAQKNDLRGYFQDLYPDWEIQFDEIFIRALQALYHYQVEGEPAAERFLNQEVAQQGITLVRPMYTALKQYMLERNSGVYNGLSEFLPELEKQMLKW